MANCFPVYNISNVYVYVYVYVYLSIYPSIHPSIDRSIYLSIYLCVCVGAWVWAKIPDPYGFPGS